MNVYFCVCVCVLSYDHFLMIRGLLLLAFQQEVLVLIDPCGCLIVFCFLLLHVDG